VLYSALALGFRCPTPETLTGLADSQAAAALADAATLLEKDSNEKAIQAAAAALAGDVALDAVEAAHRRLFGHSARGDVSPYETEWGSEALFQQPQELSDLAGFLHAFGLVLRPEAHERIDHISCECEFMAFLAFKDAYALEHGDEEMHAAVRHATHLFLRDHVARFAPAFARRLVRADRDGFYGRLGHLLDCVIRGDCRRFEVASGSDLLSLRPDPICNAPIGCDTAGDGCRSGPCGG
jgi:TorA maturation chaperone TorD